MDLRFFSGGAGAGVEEERKIGRGEEIESSVGDGGGGGRRSCR